MWKLGTTSGRAWYDPTLGRFISLAPRPVFQEHPYAFAAGNPIRFFDFTGEDFFVVDAEDLDMESAVRRAILALQQNLFDIGPCDCPEEGSVCFDACECLMGVLWSDGDECENFTVNLDYDVPYYCSGIKKGFHLSGCTIHICVTRSLSSTRFKTWPQH